MSDLVSIITPSFNRAEYLPVCIQSVRRQTYKHIEHIVVDGASNDGTREVLRKHEHLYNMKWISEPDTGMYDAINKGISMAQGEVIAYLNTDDLYLPWAVETATRALAKAEIVFGDLCVLVSSKTHNACRLQFYRPFNFQYYANFSTIGQPTVFLRRKVLDTVGLFDTSFKLLADCEYWLRAAIRGFVPAKINEVTAVQVDHQGTLRVAMERLLREEFLELRRRYAMPPSAQKRSFERIRTSLFWRKSLLTFLVNYYLPNSQRWSWTSFIEFIQSRDIPVDLRMWLLALVPYEFRRNRNMSYLSCERLIQAAIDGEERSPD